MFVASIKVVLILNLYLSGNMWMSE